MEKMEKMQQCVLQQLYIFSVCCWFARSQTGPTKWVIGLSVLWLLFIQNPKCTEHPFGHIKVHASKSLQPSGLIILLPVTS